MKRTIMVDKNAMTLALGQTVMSAGVAAAVERDPAFAQVVQMSLARHLHCDWGVVDAQDKATNDYALNHGGRILSAYTIDESKGVSRGFGDNTLWIITEWDRSVTTILFPEEY